MLHVQIYRCTTSPTFTTNFFNQRQSSGYIGTRKLYRWFWKDWLVNLCIGFSLFFCWQAFSHHWWRSIIYCRIMLNLHQPISCPFHGERKKERAYWISSMFRLQLTLVKPSCNEPSATVGNWAEISKQISRKKPHLQMVISANHIIFTMQFNQKLFS